MGNMLSCLLLQPSFRKPREPLPAAGAQPPKATFPNPSTPPSKACGEKGSKGGTQSCQGWSLWERELRCFVLFC